MLSATKLFVPVSPSPEAGDDPVLLRVVKEYLAELEAGMRPDRDRYLTANPQIAGLLAPYFDGLDMLHRGARGFARSAAGSARLDTGLSPGDRLGEFTIVREIGRGGMGVVYEAVQASLNRRVAVKVLPAEFAADRRRLQRFTSEAQAAAAVAHPNIVPVYLVGESQGVNFYAMALVAGASLDAVVAGIATVPSPGPRDGTVPNLPAAPGPFAAVGAEPAPANPQATASLVDLARRDRRAYHRSIAALGASVARALDHAHQLGVVHRDVKPANILLDTDGHVWVTDFGLAQFADAAGVTRSGMAVGTMRYMSPEQAAGDRRRLDHRTDVYSLGVTLYELATGQPAFSSDEPLTLARQLAQEEPAPPRAVDPLISVDFETVLLKAMRKFPVDRYATAAEFADDLERVVAGKPVLARRPGIHERLWKWAGRHPSAVLVGISSLVLLGLGLGLATALVTTEHARTRQALRAERQRADEAEQRFRQSKELGDLVLKISEEEIGSDSPLQGPRRRLLLAALENYRNLLAVGHDDPLVREDLDRVLARVQGLLAEQQAVRDGEAAILLRSPEVQTELGLTSKQTELVEKILPPYGTNRLVPRAMSGSGDHRRPSSPGWGSGPKASSRVWTSPDQEARAEIIRILTDEQRHRLRQLFFQVRGVMAFNDPEVVDALKLTPAQRQQIRLTQAEALAPPGRSVGRPIPGNPTIRHSPEAVEKVLERVLDDLSPEQREAWKTLIGKPFTWGR